MQIQYVKSQPNMFRELDKMQGFHISFDIIPYLSRINLARFMVLDQLRLALAFWGLRGRS